MDQKRKLTATCVIRDEMIKFFYDETGAYLVRLALDTSPDFDALLGDNGFS